MLPPSVAPKLQPAALSPADVALLPISPGAAEGSETGNPALLVSGPQAEDRPGSSLRGLSARPTALSTECARIARYVLVGPISQKKSKE